MKILEKIERWLFYLLVFFLPLQLRAILYSFRPQFNEWTSIYLYATDILIISVIFLWLVRKGWRSLRLQFGWLEKSLIVFLVITGLSLIASDNLKLSFYSFVKLLEFSVLFLYVRYNFSRLYNLERFWQIFIASASLQGVIAITQFFSQKSLGLKLLAESPLAPDIPGVAKIVVGGEKIIRAYGLVPHPNILAAILMLAIFGLVYLFIKNFSLQNNSPHPPLKLRGGEGELSGKTKKRFFIYLVYAFIFGLLSLAIFFTFSRAVIIIGLGLLFAWLFCLLRQDEFKKPAFIVLLFLVFGFLFLVLILWPYFSARYDIANLGNTQSVNLRVFYSRLAWDLIKGTPIFGIGQGTFVWTISRLEFLENWMYQPVHNVYLLIAVETGILGLLAFLWFIFLIIKKAYQAGGNKLIVCSLMFIVYSFLVVGLFDHFFWTLQQGQLMLWIILGILASFSIGPYSSTDRAQPSGG